MSAPSEMSNIKAKDETHQSVEGDLQADKIGTIGRVSSDTVPSASKELDVITVLCVSPKVV
jgi:hypothetical protein